MGFGMLSFLLVLCSKTKQQLVSFFSVSYCSTGTIAPVAIVEEPVEVAHYAGGSVTLSCSASGTPSPDIVWFKNGQPIIQNDQVSASVQSTSNMGVIQSTLSFASLMLTDDADYYCEASNMGAGNTNSATSHSVHLSVQCERFTI